MRVPPGRDAAQHNKRRRKADQNGPPSNGGPPLTGDARGRDAPTAWFDSNGPKVLADRSVAPWPGRPRTVGRWHFLKRPQLTDLLIIRLLPWERWLPAVMLKGFLGDRLPGMKTPGPAPGRETCLRQPRLSGDRPRSRPHRSCHRFPTGPRPSSRSGRRPRWHKNPYPTASPACRRTHGIDALSPGWTGLGLAFSRHHLSVRAAVLAQPCGSAADRSTAARHPLV